MGYHGIGVSGSGYQGIRIPGSKREQSLKEVWKTKRDFSATLRSARNDKGRHYFFELGRKRFTIIAATVSPEELIIVAGESTTVPIIEIIGKASGPNP